MTTIDLRRLESDFVIHFGGDFRHIRADTFAKTLLEISAALKEINRTVNPDFELEIYVDALGEGSFRAHIRTIAKKATPLVGSFAAGVAASILAAFIYEKTLSDDVEVNIVVNDDSYVVETEDKIIILPRSAGEHREKISKNPEVEKRISKAFKHLQDDQDIQNFGIAEKLDDPEPVATFPRREFPKLAMPREAIVSEENSERVKEEFVNLLIIRAILERGRRQWQFVWRDGIRISAPILHDAFYDKLASHEYVIGTGDALRVRLRIHQARDEMSGAWINQKYEVVEVLQHIAAPAAPTLFDQASSDALDTDTPNDWGTW